MNPESALIAALESMRVYASHYSSCQFVQEFDGTEAHNRPCSCGFDEVLREYEEVTGINA